MICTKIYFFPYVWSTARLSDKHPKRKNGRAGILPNCPEWYKETSQSHIERLECSPKTSKSHHVHLIQTGACRISEPSTACYVEYWGGVWKIYVQPSPSHPLQTSRTPPGGKYLITWDKISWEYSNWCYLMTENSWYVWTAFTFLSTNSWFSENVMGSSSSQTHSAKGHSIWF